MSEEIARQTTGGRENNFLTSSLKISNNIFQHVEIF